MSPVAFGNLLGRRHSGSREGERSATETLGSPALGASLLEGKSAASLRPHPASLGPAKPESRILQKKKKKLRLSQRRSHDKLEARVPVA